jgi:ankyrin repeat protein
MGTARMKRMIICTIVVGVFFALTPLAVTAEVVGLYPGLFDAVIQGDPDQVRSLLSNGADVNAGFRNGLTVLMCAALAGNFESLPRPYIPPVKSVAIGDRIEMVKLLIGVGADVNAKDDFGDTLLMYAARGGSLETVNLFIAKGLDVNARAKDGITALMFAAGIGKYEVVKTLVQKGADIDVKDNHNRTALTWAIGGLGFGIRDFGPLRVGGINYEMVKFLKDHGAKE